MSDNIAHHQELLNCKTRSCNYSLEAPDDERYRSKHVEQSRNDGIINFPTQLHLVGHLYKICIMTHGSMNVKFIKLSLSTPKRHIGGAEVQLHSFLTSSLDGREWSTSRPSRFISGKEPRCPLNRRLSESHSRSGNLQRRKKKTVPAAGIRSPDRPAQQQKF